MAYQTPHPVGTALNEPRRRAAKLAHVARLRKAADLLEKKLERG